MSFCLRLLFLAGLTLIVKRKLQGSIVIDTSRNIRAVMCSGSCAITSTGSSKLTGMSLGEARIHCHMA